MASSGTHDRAEAQSVEIAAVVLLVLLVIALVAGIWLLVESEGVSDHHPGNAVTVTLTPPQP